MSISRALIAGILSLQLSSPVEAQWGAIHEIIETNPPKTLGQKFHWKRPSELIDYETVIKERLDDQEAMVFSKVKVNVEKEEEKLEVLTK